jgi:hypothetical protein
MRTRLIGATAALLALLVVYGLPGETVARAQAADLPRTSDGKPDFSGIWQVLGSAAFDIQDHAAQKGVPAGQGVVEGNEIPYQPWALEKKRENYKNRATADPEAQCYQPGVPRITYMPFPFQIFQTPKFVTLTYEYAHATRIVYTDGTRHPEGPFYLWNGDSRGRWEGDTLVVDVADFNDLTWCDKAGNFHSDALHVVERFRREGNTLTYSVIVEDPKMFTGRWEITPRTLRLNTDPAGALVESPPCIERSGENQVTNDHH